MDYFSVVLPRRPPKNPQPCLVSSGDCGACVLAGLLGVTVEAAYDLHESGTYLGGSEIPRRSALSYYSMQRTLTAQLYAGRLDRVILDQPLWIINQSIEMNGAMGATGVLQQGAFEAYCLAMFDAGYYGVTQVAMHGDCWNKGTNHWVLLCGARRREGKPILEGKGSMIECEVLVGDSATSQPQERWVEWGYFLREHGGFMAMFARPRP